ncbi:hypothetical protein GGS26DRAFT_33811 [Hypomontagnella submonticulosa]|nr:hypothetical protein GGS26DRAFT_33811 [Hypomontagnella submonticulosa]
MSSPGGSSRYGGSVFSDASSLYTTSTQFTTTSASTATHGFYQHAVGTGVLPCEFVGLASCDLTFYLDDTDAWIEHISTEHLQEKLPSKSICWFCDDFVFDSKAREFGNDRSYAFDCRMKHIRGHIVEEGKTTQDMRPDYHMTEHLRRHKLITEEVYQLALKWTELPCPREQLRHVFPPHHVPAERRIQQERSTRVYIDQGKDDRQYRKAKAKGKNGQR